MLNASHDVLRHRRYNPIVADLKCVLNIEGVPQRFLGECFTEWMKVLSMVQVRMIAWFELKIQKSLVELRLISNSGRSFIGEKTKIR